MIMQISEWEFQGRINRIQKMMNEKKLDVIVVHSNEADPANVRYLSDYWPIFETAGIVIPQEGEAILLIGPESETFAHDRSKIRKVRKLIEYRESAEPEYPEVPVSTFEEVFKKVMEGRIIKKLGIVGYSIMSLPVYEGIKRALPKAMIVKADDIIRGLRTIKSSNEIALQREAFRISEIAMEEVIQKIKLGMTELQVVGIAQESIYKSGAEYEGHPLYVLAGRNSTHAISRPTHRVLKKGDFVQLSIGARVGGYSSSIGRPICLGKMSDKMKVMVKVGLVAHEETIRIIKAGVIAKDIAKKFFEFIKSKGFEDNLLYGPCHGLGIMEVEPPWIETSSDYSLKENMTFQVDTFLHSQEFGVRWEDGIKVTKEGVEEYSTKRKEIIEIL